MRKFVIHTFNGKEFYSIEHHDDSRSKEPLLGSFKRFNLSPENEALGLDKLIAMYREAKDAAFDSAKKASTVLKDRMIDALRGKILAARDREEADMARVQYKRLTGSEFTL